MSKLSDKPRVPNFLPAAASKCRAKQLHRAHRPVHGPFSRGDRQFEWVYRNPRAFRGWFAPSFSTARNSRIPSCRSCVPVLLRRWPHPGGSCERVINLPLRSSELSEHTDDAVQVHTIWRAHQWRCRSGRKLLRGNPLCASVNIRLASRPQRGHVCRPAAFRNAVRRIARQRTVRHYGSSVARVRLAQTAQSRGRFSKGCFLPKQRVVQLRSQLGRSGGCCKPTTRGFKQCLRFARRVRRVSAVPLEKRDGRHCGRHIRAH